MSRLASLLAQDGRVPARRMADAFQRQVIFGGSLDTILLEMGLIEEPALVEYLARATGLPSSDDQIDAQPSPSVLEVVRRGYSAPVAERFKALPLGMRGARLRVMVTDPADPGELSALGEAIGVPLDACVGPEYRFYEGQQRIYGIAMPARYAKLAQRLLQRRSSMLAQTDPNLAPIDDAALAAGKPSLFEGRAQPGRTGSGKGPAAVDHLLGLLADAKRSTGDYVAARPPAQNAQVEAAGGDDRLRQELSSTIRNWPAFVSSPAAPAPPSSATSGPPTLPSAPASAAPTPARVNPPPIPVERKRLAAPPAAAERFATALAAQTAAAASKLASRAGAATTGAGADPGWATPSPRASTEPAEAPGDTHPSLIVATLSLAEGLKALESAASRDAVFEALCRVARARFSFAAIFTIQGGLAAVRMALGPALFDVSALAGVVVDLGEPSPLKSAAATHAPFIGNMSSDEPLGRALCLLGRAVPAPVALLPIAIRDRIVAMIVADNDGELINVADLADVIQAAAAASRSFLRLIQTAKKGSDASAPQASDPVESNVPRPNDLMPSARHAAVLPREAGELIDLVAREGESAQAAASRLLTGGDETVRAFVARLPGPLRFGNRKLHTIALPVAAHGPLMALAVRFGDRIVSALAPALDDPSAELRFHAALIFGELRSVQVTAALGDCLFDPDPPVRRAASAALARFPFASTTTLLEQLRDDLGSPDTARARAAACALGDLRDSSSVPKIIDLLKHRDMEVVEFAHRALMQIVKQDFGTARWRWRSWWEKCREQSRAEWLLAGLQQASEEVKRSAAEELAVIATDRFGFHGRLSTREREDAARKFTSFWRLHPDILGDERPPR